MVLQHSAIRLNMLRASLDLIALQGPREQQLLASLVKDIERLRAAKNLDIADAARMVADLELSARELAALERRAARPGRLRHVVTRSLAAKTRQTLGPMTEVKLTAVVEELSLMADPEFHAALSRAFAAGPLGEKACWARIAQVIERGFQPRKGGNLANELAGVVNELLGASHEGYRQIIKAADQTIVELGMESVEIIGECWLIKANGKGLPLAFRDSMLLAVNTRATPFQRVGEAGIVVALEARQASHAAETGVKAVGKKQKLLQDYKLESTVKQQVRAPERARETIEAGDLLLTPDGSIYRLRPVPSNLKRNVLARPQLLPPRETKKLRKVATKVADKATAGEFPGDVLQVTTPFSSAQMHDHVNTLLDQFRKIYAP